MLSHSDYAVQLSGLEKDVPVRELEEKLLADIGSIRGGYFKDKIHHIDLGRHCAREIKARYSPATNPQPPSYLVRLSSSRMCS